MEKFKTNLLAQGQAFFTQDEFNKALGEAKAEIMAIAIQTSKQAILIERNACADLAMAWSQEKLSEAIRNRIPQQHK